MHWTALNWIKAALQLLTALLISWLGDWGIIPVIIALPLGIIGIHAIDVLFLRGRRGITWKVKLLRQCNYNVNLHKGSRGYYLFSHGRVGLLAAFYGEELPLWVMTLFPETVELE